MPRDRLPQRLVDEIVDEIERAAAKHGEQDSLPDSVWLAIATEEIGEIAQGILAEGFGQADCVHTNEEIVQAISVLVHWLEIRRNRGPRAL